MLLKGVFMRVAQQALARRYWFAALMGFILLACTFLVQARSPQEVQLQTKLLVTDLPREGQTTYEKIRKEDYPKEYSVHFMHPPKEGHAVLAEHLEKGLRELGWLPAP
jgi:hypothetical protein